MAPAHCAACRPEQYSSEDRSRRPLRSRDKLFESSWKGAKLFSAGSTEPTVSASGRWSSCGRRLCHCRLLYRPSLFRRRSDCAKLGS